jgi:putative endopeptidase
VDPSENDAWNALGQRVVTQYGPFEDPALKGVKINASLTRDANLADVSGVELAWDAWRNANPQADATAQKRSRWLGAPVGASQQPGAARSAPPPRCTHPGMWRVNGPLMNLPAFGEAYTCKAGSPMVVSEPVRVWP